jgi:poly(A) polymerase
MNALFATPAGIVTDFFGGRADLAAGIVRFVGAPAARIGEDVLRLLRYFRFHAHYGRGTAEAEALAACRAFAPSLPNLSGERVRAETLKLLSAANAAAVWRLMQENGILAHLLPAAVSIERLAALIALETALGLAPDPLRRLAALHAGAPASAAAVAQRLKFSRIDSERFAAMLADEPAIAPAPAEATLRMALYRLGRTRLLDRWLLEAARCDLSPKAARARLRAIETWPVPVLPVRGADVLALGVAPGPAVKALLAAVEDWWLAADFAPERAACLAQLQRLAEAQRAPG